MVVGGEGLKLDLSGSLQDRVDVVELIHAWTLSGLAGVGGLKDGGVELGEWMWRIIEELAVGGEGGLLRTLPPRTATQMRVISETFASLLDSSHNRPDGLSRGRVLPVLSVIRAAAPNTYLQTLLKGGKNAATTLFRGTPPWESHVMEAALKSSLAVVSARPFFPDPVQVRQRMEWEVTASVSRVASSKRWRGGGGLRIHALAGQGGGGEYGFYGPTVAVEKLCSGDGKKPWLAMFMLLSKEQYLLPPVEDLNGGSIASARRELSPHTLHRIGLLRWKLKQDRGIVGGGGEHVVSPAKFTPIIKVPYTVMGKHLDSFIEEELVKIEKQSL